MLNCFVNSSISCCALCLAVATNFSMIFRFMRAFLFCEMYHGPAVRLRFFTGHSSLVPSRLQYQLTEKLCVQLPILLFLVLLFVFIK